LKTIFRAISNIKIKINITRLILQSRKIKEENNKIYSKDNDNIIMNLNINNEELNASKNT